MKKNVEVIIKQRNTLIIEINFSLKENHKQTQEGVTTFDNFTGTFFAKKTDSEKDIKAKIKQLIVEQKQQKQAEQNKIETVMEIDFDE